MPILTSSVGRVYLAHLPETLTDPVLAGQPEASEQAGLTLAEIEGFMARVRRDGVALTSGGVVPDVTSVAAPVFTTGETLPLVVAIAMPAAQATETTISVVSAELRQTTEAISAELGHVRHG